MKLLGRYRGFIREDMDESSTDGAEAHTSGGGDERNMIR